MAAYRIEVGTMGELEFMGVQPPLPSDNDALLELRRAELESNTTWTGFDTVNLDTAEPFAISIYFGSNPSRITYRAKVIASLLRARGEEISLDLSPKELSLSGLFVAVDSTPST